MKYVSYIIYSTIWYGVSLLPFIYVVFWKNANPWWIALGTVLALTVASPQAWGIGKENKCCCKGTCNQQNDKKLILG